MLVLPIKLENKTSYKNSGPFFSRALSIKQHIKNTNHGLIITSESKHITIYAKIFNYLQTSIAKLEYENDVSNLFFNKQGLYIITPDAYYLNLDSQDQLKHHSLDIHINMEISQEDILEKLNSL
jgi:hypothetical protein